jgi:hypothetical protein
MTTIEIGSASLAAIQAALAEFAETPGRFSVRRREPAVLFEAIREILVTASGRGTSPGTEPTLSEQHAACFFVKAALLRDGADHYTLLGLDREDDQSAVKTHYRLMMRLIHPDFAAAASAQWPMDAATRVNRAYQVLSSTVLRREYDEQLQEVLSADSVRPESVYGARGSNEGFKADPLAAHRAELMRRKLKRVVAFCGLAAVGLIAYMASSLDRGHQVDLVQRKVQTTPPIAKAAEVKAPAGEVEAGGGRPALTEGAADRPAPMPALALASVPARIKGTVVAGEGAASLKPKSGVELTAETMGLDLGRSKTMGMNSKASTARETGDISPRSDETSPSPGEVISADSSPALILKGGANPQDAAESRVAVKAVVKAEPVIPGEALAKEKPPAARQLTMADAQPLIANLLHQLETGRGNNLLTVMDSDARRESSSLAFASYYDGLVGGARTVKLSQVELRPETGSGRLLVTGFVRLQLGEDVPSMKRLALRAEFASRGGTVVMTRLTGMEAADR